MAGFRRLRSGRHGSVPADRHHAAEHRGLLHVQVRVPRFPFKGLTLDEDSIKVYVKNGDTETELAKAAEGVSGYTVTAADDSTPAVDVNDPKLSADKKTEFNGATNFSVSFADLKTARAAGDGTITLDKDSKIIVRYTAKVNNNAVIGSKGNPNEANLEFSNNPNYSGETQPTGTTPNDRVIVFTYEVDINKIDDSAAQKPLSGAKFKLEKKVPDLYTEGVQKGQQKTDASGNKLYKWEQIGGKLPLRRLRMETRSSPTPLRSYASMTVPTA